LTGGFPPSVSSAEDFAMAEINKLSVGQALDKLRRPDVQSKQTRLHEKMDALDEDMQRMRATRRRLERDQRAAEMTASDAQGMNARPDNRKRPFPILAILAVVGPVLLVLIIPLYDAGAVNASGSTFTGC
jgi:hypothetical protein